MARHDPILKARDDGYNEAKQDLRKVLFDYLENKYLEPKIERGSPMAEFILEMTRELNELFKVAQ